MADQHFVRLRKESLVFSAAHFITFAGNLCERLHGHNYGVEVEIGGPLDENAYVIDFIALRDTAQAITSELDHHVLLPTQHTAIHVVVDGNEVTATFEDRRWVFPREDCVLLPLANTTAELLARHIGLELIKRLALDEGNFEDSGNAIGYAYMRVGVDENHGQWGYWCHSPGA